MSDFVIRENVLTSYEGKDNVIIIPDSVNQIEKDAFDEYELLHIEMNINCPSWQIYTDKIGSNVHSIINVPNSTISFVDNDSIVAKIILATNDESYPKKNKYISCIKADNGKFDFAEYDNNFYILTKKENKVLVALARLSYPYELGDEIKKEYISTIKRNALLAGKWIIDNNDLKGLMVLEDNVLINEKVLEELIEYANSNKNNEFVASLLDYKDKNLKNIQSTKKLSSISEKEIVSANEKSVSDWRKIYKYKYSHNGIYISDYKGNNEEVIIPDKIGNKDVIGISGYAFMAKETIKRIVVPSSIVTIEKNAFLFCHDMEIEIQEGIEKLDRDVFDEMKNVTIKLPSSINDMNIQFSGSFNEKNKLIVVEGSCAEQFAKKNKISYDTVKQDTIKPIIKKNKTAPIKKSSKEWLDPKKGTKLISRYMGDSSEVIYPTKVNGIIINGIANTVGETPDNYLNIKKVIIPEGYEYIGNKAFAGCENLETISLPSSIKEIGTQAFSGCKKLKEIVINKNVVFKGKDVFMDSNIDTVIVETEKTSKIEKHLFFNCDINNLVVVGGPFKSNSNIFDYTGASANGEYFDKNYIPRFPKAIYIDDIFSTLDIKGVVGKENINKIHPLSEFCESTVIDATFKNLISKQKG